MQIYRNLTLDGIGRRNLFHLSCHVFFGEVRLGMLVLKHPMTEQ